MSDIVGILVRHLCGYDEPCNDCLNEARSLAAALSAAGFGPVREDTLRAELIVYVELLEHIDRADEGIDGDAVPRELRDILKRTTEASS